MTFARVSHQECRIAFATNDPEKLAKQMVYGGAKIVSPAQKDSNGDIIIDFNDPSDFPIRTYQTGQSGFDKITAKKTSLLI